MAPCEILNHPPHVVQQLAYRLVPPSPNFQLDNNEPSFTIKRKHVNEAILHGELNARLISSAVKARAGLDACGISSPESRGDQI